LLGTDEAIEKFNRDHPELSRPRRDEAIESNPAGARGEIRTPIPQKTDPQEQAEPASKTTSREAIDRAIEVLHNARPAGNRLVNIPRRAVNTNIALRRTERAASKSNGSIWPNRPATPRRSRFQLSEPIAPSFLPPCPRPASGPNLPSPWPWRRPCSVARICLR
jgi:hypothetical protein